MYEELEFLFKKDDEVICPSCHKIFYVQKDIPISDLSKLVKCPRCWAMSRWENWEKLNTDK